MYPFERDRDRGGGGGGRGPRGRGRDPPPKVIRIDQKPVELHKAEQRWMPAKERMKDLSEMDKATEDLYRKFQAILNKLTPQKFQSLAEQALTLTINTEERLKGVIDKIFTKALEEPNFSIAYANLCKVLSPLKVDVSVDGKKKITTFRRVLLTKCQQEFEKDKKDDEEREEMLVAIEKAETEEKRKELVAELKVMETKARKRSLGNIRFIGELFKLKVSSQFCQLQLNHSNNKPDTNGTEESVGIREVRG
jgi:translation initiation factor 4G